MIEHVQQAKKNRSLFEAAEKGDIDRVKQLVTEGADINAQITSHGETALHIASARGHLKIVELLLAKGETP